MSRRGRNKRVPDAIEIERRVCSVSQTFSGGPSSPSSVTPIMHDGATGLAPVPEASKLDDGLLRQLKELEAEIASTTERLKSALEKADEFRSLNERASEVQDSAVAIAKQWVFFCVACRA